MQLILSNYNEKHPESSLGVLNSYLIPEYGHKHLYTMSKRDIDGLHKDKFHRLAPSSFTVSINRNEESQASFFCHTENELKTCCLDICSVRLCSHNVGTCSSSRYIHG